MKRINKILWHGVDIPIPSAYEGSLDGLNCGELYIYENDEDPAIFIKTNKNKVKRIGGGGGGTTDINEILDLIDQKLNGYATEEWVSSTYATKKALSTLSSSVNSLRTDFDNLNALLNDDVEGKINTWYEVVDFLDEYSGSQDLAAILSGMNTDIASRVEKSKFAEYFNSEMAKWFVKDDDNKGLKPANSYGLYSETYVSAKGVNTGTGGSGGGSSYDRLDKWSDYTTDKAGWVLSALLGQDLNSRVASLESGSALSLVTTGDGNAVTAIAKSGNQLTVTKGSTFQSLITSSNKLSYSLISGTPTSLPASDVAAWAKAASKPSYAFSEITNKPTTLGGYGITDAYTATTIDGKLSGYLPLSGGTIEDSIGGAFSVDRINASEAYIRLLSRGVFKGAITAGNDTYGVALYNAVNGCYLGITDDGNPYYIGASRYTLIHSGNIGSQSVASATTAGDSDMLGGVTHSNYMISFRSDTQDVNQSPYTAERPYILRVGSGNANLPAGMQYGNIAHFSAYGADTAFELFGAYSGQTLLYRCGETNAMFSKGWKTIAFTDSNVASATKLQTPRNIWGQSFDGTGNVSGHITNASSFRFSGDIGIWQGNLWSSLNTDDIAYNATRHAFWGNVGIGTTTGIGHSTAKLQIYSSENDWVSIHYTDNTAVFSASQLGYGMLVTSKYNNSGKYLLSIRYNDSYLMGLGSSALSVFDNGNVGIGTTSPTERLHVVGNIVATGGVSAKSSSSDIRLKKELTEYSALDIIKNQRSVMYKWNDVAKSNSDVFKTDAWQYGLIAQELQATHPQLVSDVFGDYLTINYERLIPIVWRGVQEVDDEVTRLKAEVKELKNRISIMEGGRYGC